MKPSEVVTEATALELRQALVDGQFPGITFEHAMEFLLTDGLFPASGLPVESFLKLSAWAAARLDVGLAACERRPREPQN